MKLYAVMYWLDVDMKPEDTCLCFEIHTINPAIYQTREAAEQEMEHQIELTPHLPHSVFEMSNEIMRKEL